MFQIPGPSRVALIESDDTLWLMVRVVLLVWSGSSSTSIDTECMMIILKFGFQLCDVWPAQGGYKAVLLHDCEIRGCYDVVNMSWQHRGGAPISLFSCCRASVLVYFFRWNSIMITCSPEKNKSGPSLLMTLNYLCACVCVVCVYMLVHAYECIGAIES